jgi:Protein of unknown function (DUF3592)
MNKGWSLALPAAMVLAGIAAIVYVLVASASASRSDRWSQVRATVERVDASGVAYRYDTVGGPQRSTGTGTGTYAAGSKVLVYVNPANPAESLLQLPPRPPFWPALAGGVAILFGAALGGYVWWRKPAMSRAKPAGKDTAPGKNGTNPGPRKAAPPMSRLRPPPAVKREAPVHDDVTDAD